MSPTAPIRLFYTLKFTYLDPPPSSASTQTTSTSTSRPPSSPPSSPTPPRTPPAQILFHNHAALMLSVAVVSGILLRYTRNITVWHIVQMGILVANVVMLGALVVEARRGGRTDVRKWRSEDWDVWGIIGGV
ncbi:hypothetical protein M501DRAFT_995898 [Patellaria atrata CBS 101060]|uniref:Uncharacterized protein n=1 Tax=Patellaria atrata CBS 101060 TaxID=1346257 RepID=A0A9P4VPH8_9PEZI|nr:hypothetical protein M501DRAFT_995898 [Patellaria atrata CBS 101060]